VDAYIYSPQVVQFVETLYTEDFIVPSDWFAWQDEAARSGTDPSLLDSADLPTLQKLLATHVRADRFSSGHLAQTIESGHILWWLHAPSVLEAGTHSANGTKRSPSTRCLSLP
jgi:hypothetical protein